MLYSNMLDGKFSLSDSDSDSSFESSSSTALKIMDPLTVNCSDEGRLVDDILKRPQPKHKWFTIPELLKRYSLI